MIQQPAGLQPITSSYSNTIGTHRRRNVFILQAAKKKTKSSGGGGGKSRFGGAAMEPCPCGSEESYSVCCGKIHRDIKAFQSATAEQVVRARYSAYSKKQVKCLFYFCARYILFFWGYIFQEKKRNAISR